MTNYQAYQARRIVSKNDKLGNRICWQSNVRYDWETRKTTPILGLVASYLQIEVEKYVSFGNAHQADKDQLFSIISLTLIPLDDSDFLYRVRFIYRSIS